MSALKVLGLDISTAATGLARTHDSAGQPRLSVQTIDSAKRPLHVQTDIIELAVRRAAFGLATVGNRDLRPDVVVIEGQFSTLNGADYPLHHVRACVTQWLARKGIPYVDVSPAKLKVWATGSGATHGENKVTKQQVCEAVVATYGRFLHINPNDDNSCDAVALLTMALHAYGEPLAEVPESHSRALKGLVWPNLTPQGAPS